MGGKQPRSHTTYQITALLLVVLLISSCGTPAISSPSAPTSPTSAGQASPSAPYQLTLAIEEGSPKIYEGFFNAVKQKFEDSHPGVTVVYREIPFDRLKDTLALEISQGSCPADVSSGVGAESEMFYRGMTQDITDALKSWPEYQYYPEMSRKATSYFGTGPLRGRSVGISIMPSTTLLMYNKEFVREAGIDKIPQTWDEFEAALEKVKQANLTSPAGKVFPFLIPNYRWYPLSFLYQNGCQDTNADGTKLTLNSDACVGAFQWIDKLIEKGYVPVPDPTSDARTVAQAFENKRAVFGVGCLNASAGLIQAGVDVGFAPLPRGKVDATVGGGGYNFVALKCSQHKQDALDYLHILLGNDVALAGAKYGVPPALTNADISLFVKENPQFNYWPEQLKDFKTAIPTSLEWPWFDPGGADKLQAAIDAILLLKADPKTELDKLVTSLQPSLDKAVANPVK